MKVIYQILNKVNGKFYIGSSYDYKRRKQAHLWQLRNNQHKCPHLQHSWNKHGENSFEFVILEELTRREELIPREQYYLDKLKPQYNILQIAGSSVGHKFRKSKEAVEKTASKRRVQVLKYDFKGVFVCNYVSLTEAALKNDTSISNIWDCCNGKIDSFNNEFYRYRDMKYEDTFIAIKTVKDLERCQK